MKAAVVQRFGEPLVIEDRPVPEPGPGQITVRMEASGLCHTDIHAANGDWPVKPTPPFVPGHEGVGTVHAIGAGVNGVTEGDVFALHAAVRTQVIYETRPLDGVNEAIAEVLHGKAKARLVPQP